jgi:hypothetical protein
VLTSCPGVSDVDGLVYWSQTDESGGVRVYQEDRHHGHWTIQAQNREDLGKLSFSVADPGSWIWVPGGGGDVAFSPLDPGSGIGFFRMSDPGSQTHTFESLMTMIWAESSIILCKLAQIFFFTS